jgi:hypothetical protein
LNLLAAGWQVNGITTFQSGQPLLMNNAPTNTIGFNAAQRIDNNGHSPLLPADQRTQNRWFDTSVFSLPAPFHFGNVNRYSPVLRGANVNSWNASLFKSAILRERYRLQFRAEFFNLMNHPIWAAPGATINTSTFGVTAQKNGNRTGQLGLKLLF